MSSYKKAHSKLLFRIDFQPTLKYIDQMYKAASALEGEYENWKASQSSSYAVLFDKETRKQVIVDGQSISFITSNEDALENPYAEISKLLVLFLSDSDIPKVRRIGVRRMSLHSVNRTYDEFVEAFFKAFYGSQEELKSITSDKLDDVVVVIQGIKDGLQNRNQFGPLKNQEEVERIYGLDEYETREDININNKMVAMVDTDIHSSTERDFDSALAITKEILVACEDMHKSIWDLVELKV